MPASPSLTPSQEPPASSGHVARVSLRLRVLALVAAANVVVFGAGLAHLSTLLRDAEEQAEREYSVRGRYALESAINERGELRVAQILTWPFWGAFSDAVITDLHARGVSLNPVGSAQRDATFDREGIQRAIEDAVRRRESVPIAGGRAMAILDDRGRAWGGVWFRVGEAAGTSSLWTLLPWFFGSTLLLFGGTFWVLRRYVLQPVGELAEAAGRVRRGDLGVTVELPPHRDELTDLMDTFNHMTAEVKDFHDHLEVEAHEARRAAFAAEAAALRQRRLAAMGELAAGIAHEINNPLGGMLNAVDVLDREGLASEKRARYHELLRGGLQRIQATVAGLLRFTPRAAPHAPLDLAGPVQDAIALMHHGARKAGVEVTFADRAGGARTTGAAPELGQAVLNLLTNALHAIEDRQRADGSSGGRIDVVLDRAGDELRLAVGDDGVGVAVEDLERMTDLFYTTKEVGRGTGLGLALVLGVVNQHGGRVHFERREPRGLVVEVFLALAEEGA